MCVPIPIHISLLITEILPPLLPFLVVVVFEAESQLSFTSLPLEVSVVYQNFIERSMQ